MIVPQVSINFKFKFSIANCPPELAEAISDMFLMQAEIRNTFMAGGYYHNKGAPTDFDYIVHSITPAVAFAFCTMLLASLPELDTLLTFSVTDAKENNAKAAINQ